MGTRPCVPAFDEGPPIGHAPCRGGPCGRPPKPGGGTPDDAGGDKPRPYVSAFDERGRRSPTHFVGAALVAARPTPAAGHG
ncbi:MAG: hypothetical protein ACLRWQ_11165 [Flavonifractor plautii]